MASTLRGTLRALLTNLHAGEVVQGGSTITQQVAKAFLSSERTLSRKIKEAIFARRLEGRYSKREILALYLNHIFLGSGAYGVEAAARRYFDKDVWQLDLAQMAMIAGLARAPSRDNPLTDEEAALKRRATVLDNMVENGVLARADAEKWKRAPLEVHPRRDYFHEVTPYFSEQVRRELVKKLGQHALYEGGYRVETTVLPWVDVAAQENVDAAVRKLDKRQGWRGPEARLTDAQLAEFRARERALYGTAHLIEGKLYLGLVEKVNSSGATVRVGARNYFLPLENMQWAAPFSATDATNDKTITSATEALKRHDVVWVKWAYRGAVPRYSDFTYNEEGEATWLPEQPYKKPPKTVVLALEQTPRVQAALYTYDHHDGYVLAMAGGDDFDRSEFNRVTQACRQPGSAYKPIFYSLALDRGYSFSTLWNDKPKAEIDPTTGQLWIPQNVDGSYNVSASLERALVWSKNPPSVEIFHILGTPAIEKWAHRLGLTTPLVTSPKCEKEFCSSLALGASCVHMDEMTRAFSVFAQKRRARRSGDDPARRRSLRQGDHRSHRLGRSVDEAGRAARSGRRHRRRNQGTGDPAAHRLSHLQAAARDRHHRPLRPDPLDPDPFGRQDRHLQPHLGRLVRRLHLALDDHRLDRRRHLSAPARLQGCVVHAQRADVGALHVRGRARSAAQGHPVGGAARGQGERHRRAAQEGLSAAAAARLRHRRQADRAADHLPRPADSAGSGADRSRASQRCAGAERGARDPDQHRPEN